MRMSALILIVMAATLPMAPASPQDKANPPRKEQTEELPPPPGLLPPGKGQLQDPAKSLPAKTVKELQKERIATLKEAVDVIAELYKIQRAPPEEVTEARLLLLKAQLDAAEKESDRITLYKKIVDVMKEEEIVVESRFQGARVSPYSVLKAKARRLKAEIDLERAKAKEAKKAK
jgi:outer membrane protein TolC